VTARMNRSDCQFDTCSYLFELAARTEAIIAVGVEEGRPEEAKFLGRMRDLSRIFSSASDRVR
jgi:hypothetical protein